MPPKRNKDDKKKEKGKKNAPKYEPINPCDVMKPKHMKKVHEDNLEEETKNEYQLQIKNCSERLLEYQRKADELTVKADSYHQMFEQLDVDEKDLSSYLSFCLKIKEEELIALKEDHQSCIETKQAQTFEYQNKIEKMNSLIKNTKRELTEQNEAMISQINSMKLNEEEKQEVGRRIAEFARRIAESQKIGQEKTYQQERSATMAVERLRREADKRVNAVAADCTKIAGQMLKEAVKQSVIESVEANRKIDEEYSDGFITELLRRNKALHRKTDENQRIVDILETNCRKMEFKNKRLEEITRLLVEKMKAQDSDIKKDFHDQSDKELLHQLEFLKLLVDENSKMLTKETDKRDALQDALVKVKSALTTTTVANRDLYEVLKEARPGIEQLMMHVENVNILQTLDSLPNEELSVAAEICDSQPPKHRKKVQLMQKKQRKCKKV